MVSRPVLLTFAESRLLAINAGTEAAEIWSVVTPTPGVKAEPAISGAERTRMDIGDDGEN